MTVSSADRSDVSAQSDAARLALALGRTSRWIRRQQTRPLGQGAISALATISRDGPLRLGDVAAREGLAAASLSRIVAVLVTEGYVDRIADPDDGRCWQVATTAQGERLLSELRTSSARVILERLDRLEARHRNALLAALPALEALPADGADNGEAPLGQERTDAADT